MRRLFRQGKGTRGSALSRLLLPLGIAGTLLFLFTARESLSFITPSFVKMTRSPEAGDEEGPATFPHAAHQRVMKCFNCHPSIFSYDKNIMTHDDFDQGKFCATCHDGRIAWDIEDADCETCHVD